MYIKMILLSIWNLPWRLILEIFATIVGGVTIYSIFHGINVYREAKKIEEENNKIILENTKSEITLNIEIIGYIRDRVEYKSRNLFAERYNYYFLEKSLKIINDLDTRTLIMNTLTNMRTTNSFLRTYENSLFNSLTLSEESFIELEEKNKLIETNLKLILLKIC